MLIFTNQELLKGCPDVLFGIDLGEFKAAQEKLSDQLSEAIRGQLGIKD